MKLPRPLSHSSISMYLDCHQKWKFKYVDGLPEKPRHFFSFGQCLHRVLEFFYGVQALPAPSLEELLGFYERHWIREGYRDEAHEREYREEGMRILTAFYARHIGDYHIPFFVEYNFNLEVEGVPVTGKIDRIDKRPDGTLSIVDYKTGKAISIGRVREDAQLTMYQMACEELLGLKVADLTFYHLPSLTPLTVPPHAPPLVDALRTRIVGVAGSIEAEAFEPMPEERKCSWCDFKPHCPVFKHLYITHHEAETPPEMLDSEIAELVDRLGQVREQIRELRATAADLEEETIRDMKKKEYLSAAGERYRAELATEEAWEFDDKEAFKRLLRSYGLFERILVPSVLQLQKLLKEDRLPEGFMASAGKLGRKIEKRSVNTKRIEET